MVAVRHRDPVVAAAGYPHRSPAPTHIRAWVWPRLRRQLPPPPADVCDLGCGNGWTAAELDALGYSVTGLEPSSSGIAIAQGRGIGAHFRQWSAYDGTPEDLRERFDVVVSLDVIEHLYAPRELATRAMELLRPNGVLFVSTPYHGYVKNVALAVTGRLDAHFTALWDHGHIKFFSKKTLASMLTDAGFVGVTFFTCGRLPMLWKSMVVRATKPRKSRASCR